MKTDWRGSGDSTGAEFEEFAMYNYHHKREPFTFFRLLITFGVVLLQETG